MGECGLRGGYAEIVNMDPEVKALYLKSISAKLCPTGIHVNSLLTFKTRN
jgi:alanine transaminase